MHNYARSIRAILFRELQHFLAWDMAVTMRGGIRTTVREQMELRCDLYCDDVAVALREAFRRIKDA